MRSRAAFLPSPGDPYVLLNTISYFHFWEEEVDALYININSDVELEVIDALKALLIHPKIKLIYQSAVVGHGEALNRMLDACVEDNILFIEDDSLIFKSGVVDHYFNIIESNEYDIIGSPRMSCSLEWAEIAKNKFNLDYSGYGDKGPNYWPCFLWCKKRDLLNTDRNFSNTGFKKGSLFLNSVLNDDVAADTFAWATMQLREQGLRFFDIPQYHANPHDEQNKINKIGIFDGKCPYIHLGSLSSGIASYLIDENGRRLKERIKYNIIPAPLQSPLDMDRAELERRVAWWKEAFDVGTSKYGFYVAGFSDSYLFAINNLIKICDLNATRVSRWTSLYKEVMK